MPVMPRQRLRLPPQVRANQILDAARDEFSERGFAATRMEDIARRCGLSKGGLYAHFYSKEGVFEALLNRSLQPLKAADLPNASAGAGLRQRVECLVERLHASLDHPDTAATLRLLLAEGERLPHRVAQWHELVIEPNMHMLSNALIDCAQEAGLQNSLLQRNPWLALTPVVHALVMSMVFGADSRRKRQYIQAHVDLLCELLQPRQP
jgi:AcrR family transcriptional regulator